MKTILNFIIENPSIIISILALVLSLINFIYLIITNMKRVELIIDSFSKGKVDNKIYYFFNITITNKSRLPIAINEISIKTNQENFTFFKSPRLLCESQVTRGKEVIRRKEIYSAKFPLNINGLCSEQFFLMLYAPEEINNEENKMIVKTSRGKTEINIKKLDNYFIEDNNFFEELRNYN